MLTGGYTPLPNAVGVLGSPLMLQFDQSVQPGTGADTITVYKASDNSVLAQVLTTDPVHVHFTHGSGLKTDGTQNPQVVTPGQTDLVSVSLPNPLPAGTSVYVQIAAGAFTNFASTPEQYAGISDTSTWSFTTPAFGLTATSPTSNAVEVPLNSNLTLTFNNTVPLGNGTANIYLYNAVTNSVVDTFSAGDASHVAISGNTVTITPKSGDLANDSTYYLRVDPSAFKDTSSTTNTAVLLSEDFENVTLGPSPNRPGTATVESRPRVCAVQRRSLRLDRQLDVHSAVRSDHREHVPRI